MGVELWISEPWSSVFVRNLVMGSACFHQISSWAWQWSSLVLLLTSRRLNNLLLPTLPLVCSTCPESVAGSFNSTPIATISSGALQFSKIRWLCKAVHGKSFAYLSLFCLDFSSSSFKTGDDLNLASLSAYFFWFASAPSRTACKSVNITRQRNTAMESEARLESQPFNFFRNSISGSRGPGTDSSPENPDMIPASTAGKSLDHFDWINFWAIYWIKIERVLHLDMNGGVRTWRQLKEWFWGEEMAVVASL